MNTEKIYDPNLLAKEQLANASVAPTFNDDSAKSAVTSAKTSFVIKCESLVRNIIAGTFIVLLGFAVTYRVKHIWLQKAENSSPLLDFVFK